MDRRIRKIKELINKYSKEAEFIEVRLQELKSSYVRYYGKELEDIGARSGIGGCVRVLVNGAWGFVSFNTIEEISSFIERAIEFAGLSSSNVKIKKATSIVDEIDFSYYTQENPIKISLEEKEALCRKYNQILLSHKEVKSTSVTYKDTQSEVILINSEGATISQKFTFCGISIAVFVGEGTNIQQAYYSNGDLRGFSKIRGLEEKCIEICKRAYDQMKASPIRGGIYDVILDQKLGGVFIHEAFGHLSEADFLYENPRLLEMMKIGKQIGPEFLNVIDDSTISNLAGSYKYDSEGTPGQKTYLIKDGYIAGRLHSLETAEKMEEAPTGNARAISYQYEPIVRMSNTYIDRGPHKFEDMLESTEYGLYVCGAIGGQTNMEMFTFSAEEGFIIEKGKIKQRVKDIVLTGNVFETLKNIEMIGDDLKFFGGLGGCGKGAQSPLRVADGAPHIKIKKVLVGGRTN